MSGDKTGLRAPFLLLGLNAAVLFLLPLDRLAERGSPWIERVLSTHVTAWIELCCSIAIAIAVVAVVPKLRDIRKDTATAQSEHARFLAAAESTIDDFYIFEGVPDASGKIVDFRFSYINPNAERRLRTPRESLVGKILTEVRPFMIKSGLIEKYREVVRTGKPFTTEVFVDDDMIKATWLNVQVVKLGDGIAITSRDVTEKRRLTDRIDYLAHHDELTGLANRVLFRDRLQQALLRAQRNGWKVAIFMLDIDHFKRVNDSFGHAGGDALLASIGQRLIDSVRETDTVARIGGDEFVVLMPEFQSLEEVRARGLRIVENVSQAIAIEDCEVKITVSVGACVYPDCGVEIEELLKNADAAMYRIKDLGKNGLQIFEQPALNDSTGSPKKSLTA